MLQTNFQASKPSNSEEDFLIFFYVSATDLAEEVV